VGMSVSSSVSSSVCPLRRRSGLVGDHRARSRRAGGAALTEASESSRSDVVSCGAPRPCRTSRQSPSLGGSASPMPCALPL